jgi:molybdopterin-containing oxidoreductase family membrane subunit
MSSATQKGIASKQIGILVVALIGFALAGGVVLNNLAAEGHAAYNTSNLGLFWTFPIVVYDYFLLTSTGLTMVATLAIILGGEDFRPIIRRAIWLALAGLAGGVMVLMLELGHPLRAFLTIPTSFAFSSPLFWKVICIILYVLSLLVLLARTMKSGWSLSAVRTNAIFSLVLALAVTAIAGVVYGSQSFRPFWASGDIPVAFIFESLLGGMAFIYFFSYLAYVFKPANMPESLRRVFNDRLPTFFALVIFIQLLFVLARMTNGLYGNVEGLQVWQRLANSPLFISEVLIGLLLPLGLLINSHTRTQAWAQILSSFLVMVALLVARYEYIIDGQVVPLFKGSWAPEMLSYFPSVTEWLLLLVAVFLANIVNSFGELVLRLGDE